MPANPITAKRALRSEVRALLQQIPAEERTRASAQVCSQLKQQAVWRCTDSILFFAPLLGEVDIWPLLVEALTSGKRVGLPRFDPGSNMYMFCRIKDPDRDLVSGKLGIREPGALCPRIVPSRVALILVPGVAFDLNGRRLGRGKGFYDRLLAPLEGMKCGVAFDQQIVNEVPAEEHDVQLDSLLTPTRWLEFKAVPAPPIT